MEIPSRSWALASPLRASSSLAWAWSGAWMQLPFPSVEYVSEKIYHSPGNDIPTWSPSVSQRGQRELCCSQSLGFRSRQLHNESRCGRKLTLGWRHVQIVGWWCKRMRLLGLLSSSAFHVLLLYVREPTDVVNVGTLCQVITSLIVTLSLLLVAQSTATAKASRHIVIPSKSPTWPPTVMKGRFSILRYLGLVS